MVLCSEAHDVECSGCIGEEYLVKTAVILILIREIEVIGIIIEADGGPGILCRGHHLVERNGSTAFLSLHPVIAVSCQTQHDLVVGNIPCSPVRRFLNPPL